MIPYTGEYIEHFDPEKPSLKFYSFTPRPLMHGDMYQMDDELATLLIEAHRNIGFLEGLVKYAPNKEAVAELIHAPNQFFSFDTLKSLLLPLVLLVFNLPVVFGLALYNTYEQIFIRIKGSKSEQKKMKWQVIRFSGINLSKVSAIRKSLPNTIVCCRTSKDLQISLDKLARRLDLQIGENYMKRSRYYVSVCIAGLILSLIGLIGANSDVSLKDIVTLNFVFDIPRIKEILTYIFSTMIVFSATLLFFAIGFIKSREKIFLKSRNMLYMSFCYPLKYSILN